MIVKVWNWNKETRSKPCYNNIWNCRIGCDSFYFSYRMWLLVPQNLVCFVKKCFHWQKVKVGCIFHHKFDFKIFFWICVEDEIGFAFLLKLLNIGFENFSILRSLCLKLEKILDVYSSRYWPMQVKTSKILFKNQIIEIENCEILLIRPEVVLGCTNRQSFLF